MIETAELGKRQKSQASRSFVNLVIPQMGEGLQEVKIIRFFKKVGDWISEDEVVYEMETDKATVEVESPYSGRLLRLLAAEGDQLAVGDPLAQVEIQEESTFSLREKTVPTIKSTRSIAIESTEPVVLGKKDLRSIPPRTRAYCKERGISHDEMLGIPISDGKLMPSDVDKYLESRQAVLSSPNENSIEHGRADYRELLLSPQQQLLNQRFKKSQSTIVPATMVSILSIDELRRAIWHLTSNTAMAKSQDFISEFQAFAYIVARTCAEFPKFRSFLLNSTKVRESKYVNLGIAVETEKGDLVTAVIKEADRLSFLDFITSVQQKIQLAITGEDQGRQAPHILLSYMGQSGVVFGAPLLVEPAVATLFLGSNHCRKNKTFANLSLTFEHRLINGLEAAKFLQRIVEIIRAMSGPFQEEKNVLKRKFFLNKLQKNSIWEEFQEWLLQKRRAWLVKSIKNLNGFIKKIQATRERTLQGEQEIFELLKQDLTRMVAESLKLPLDSMDPMKKFSQYGADSITFIELANRLKKQYKISILFGLFFKYPTLDSLAGSLWQSHRSQVLNYYVVSTQRSPELIPVDPPEASRKVEKNIRIKNEERIPLSLNQQQLYAACLLNATGIQYNVGMAFELKGDLSFSILQKALDLIVARQDSLRMNFIMGKEALPELIIRPSLNIKISVENLVSLADEQKEDKINELIQHFHRQSFDLAKDALLRCQVVQLEKESFVLLILLHHIITDGWSVGLFIQELTQNYNTLLSNRAYQPPSLPTSYINFIQWQHGLLTEQQEQIILAFWQQQLHNPPQPLVLPRKNGLHSQELQRSEHSISLSKGLSQALKVLAETQSTSLFICLFSAYQILLARYSQQSDIIVGVPFFGREEAQFQETQGYFINMLPLRAQLMETTTFAQLLQQNNQLVSEVQTHPFLSLGKLSCALKISRSLNELPLFQVSFNLINIPLPKLKLAGLQARMLWRQGGQTDYDLAMEVLEEAGQLQLTLNYNASRFDQAFIQQLLRHYVCLLENVISKTDELVWFLELMNVKEKQKILIDWNNTRKNDYENKAIHQLFEKQAEKFPDNIAVFCDSEQLTYQALNIRANQLAHYLREQGIQPDSLVAIACERSLEMIIGMLAILKAGGAYVPIDPDYPKERTRFMLEDARASLLLSQQAVLDKLPDTTLPIFLLDKESEKLRHYPTTNPEPITQPHHLAYVIYTSGSTGKPKGVMVEHHGITNLATAQSELFGIHEKSRVLQFSSMNFDAAVSEWATTFSQGACLCLVKSKEQLVGDALVKTLEALKITVVTLPPTVLATLPESRFYNLETLVIAGETAAQNLVDKWQKKVRLLNAYGPTETTVCASVASYQSGMSATVIGKPIANTKLYILDKYRQPVPIGVEGELYIGGLGLARGYLNQPELTKERFISNPFLSKTEHTQGIPTKLYRTGDLARYLPEGNIEYLGRIDQQVKLRGYRIELGEIEQILRAQTNIQDALVILREDDPQDKRLVAYLILDPLAGVSVASEEEMASLIAEWREGLQQHLPEYMIPSAFVLLEHYPLTPTHKLDRKALPPPDKLYRTAEQSFVAPRNQLEREIADLWAEILSLKTEQISMEDNFFYLGGNSLSSIRLMQALKQKLNRDVSVADIFTYPTIAALATRAMPAENRLASRSTKEMQTVLPIKTQGEPTLFLIHPLGGLALAYLPLANYLNCALYGLQDPYFGQNNSFDSIEMLVDNYTAQLRMIQPQGPYYLGGWSLGGNIALLMADKLKNQGETVKQLFLIDSFRQLFLESLSEEEEQTLLQHLASQLRGPDGELSYQDNFSWRSAVSLQIKASIKLLSGVTFDLPYEGAVSLIKAKALDCAGFSPNTQAALHKLFKNPTNGWGPILPNLKVVIAPGSHYELFSLKYLGSTATVLQHLLDNSSEQLTDFEQEQLSISAES